MMNTTILMLNLIVSLASAAWAVVALVRPAILSGSSYVERGETLYARMYAARALPFGLAAGMLPLSQGGKAVAWILFAAAVVQMIDVVIAAGRKEPRMIAGATVGAAVHVLCGLAITQSAA